MTTGVQVPSPAEVPVVILAGGRGTRLIEKTRTIPKPMVTVGGRPILVHIMRYYGAYGFQKFVICLGYKGHVIKNYFRGWKGMACPWKVSLVETGEDSLTATRLCRVREYLTAPHFCLTYGDGLSDLALDKEWAFHLRHSGLGTVAAVHPPARFGKLELDRAGLVRAFREKEILKHDYINGGFFIFRREFLDRLSAEANESLESRPLEQLAAEGELHAFQHEGFWQCMDTVRDREVLEGLYESGSAPWVK